MISRTWASKNNVEKYAFCPKPNKITSKTKNGHFLLAIPQTTSFRFRSRNHISRFHQSHLLAADPAIYEKSNFE